MKNSNKLFFAVLFVFNLLLYGIKTEDIKTAVMYCDYTGSDNDIIYKVPMQVNYATVFELPAGKEIKHVVLGDPLNWKAKVDDDGKMCFVKPMEQGIRTSLSIVTTENKTLVFSLVENSGDLEKQVVAKVKIQIMDDEFFIKKTRDEVGIKKPQEKKEEEILQFIRKKSKKYKVRSNQFFVENVCDDGVFTYLYVPKAQYRPAIYYKEKKGELEPIRYIDKGDYYVIHKVLTNKGSYILLKLGKTETKIKMVGG